MSEGRGIVGWDVGGVQVKAAHFSASGLPGSGPDRVASEPFEIWRGPERLADVLATVFARVGAEPADRMAITMTAELSDAFRSKREGVLHVLDAFATAFPGADLAVLGLEGTFASPETARSRPLSYAATNWLASARWLAREQQAGVMLDVGSTTTDIIPFADGRALVQGGTDVERLLSGELLYTGVVRTNPNTMVRTVPLRGGWCRVAAEHFTCMGDVYVLLGRLDQADYSTPTPDGRDVVSGAAARLSRLVCCDEETLSREEVMAIAGYVAEEQLETIVRALHQVLSRADLAGLLDGAALVAAGAGAFLAEEIGRRSAREVINAAPNWPAEARRALPASAVGALLRLEGTGL